MVSFLELIFGNRIYFPKVEDGRRNFLLINDAERGVGSPTSQVLSEKRKKRAIEVKP